MNPNQLFHTLLDAFPFAPTSRQEQFFKEVSAFITMGSDDAVYILKGYAGTGKTTVISTLVNNLSQVGLKSVLLAPTGRAAKVISGYAAKPAYTIHKKIYFPKKNPGGISFTSQVNKHRNTIFIIDEASMISDADSHQASVLEDLIHYVYSGSGCKMILVGDTAQLPPVNLDVSPALDADTLSLHYAREVTSIELDEVMRQEQDSGILTNATTLRELLKEDFLTEFRFFLKGFRDIVRLSDGYEIQDAIEQAYSCYSIEDTAFIVRSNKRANQYNQQIRTRVLDRESEISTGDYLMVVRNNYFWLKETDEAGFIANGDIVEVLELFGIKELYGFKFASAKVRMVDYPNQIPLETVLLLDTLTSEAAAMTQAQYELLYQQVLIDYQDEPSKYKRAQKVKENEYFNALQVKFAYAITCHKSQGGQWNTVFIEQPYLPEGISRDYVRWLYTAVTRAKEKVYLIGFPNEFFTE
jgi:ATP-dependent exoDNAse (exonuclease V) alpha subunit